MMVFTRSSTTAKESKSSRGASKPKISHIKTTKTTKKESKASTKSRDVLKLYVKLNAPAEVLLVTLPLESTVDDLCVRILELYAEHFFDTRPALPTPFDVRNHANALVSRSEQIRHVFDPEEMISVTARTSSSQRSPLAVVNNSPVSTEPTSSISTETLQPLGLASPSTNISSAIVAFSNSPRLEESFSATCRGNSVTTVKALPRKKCDSSIWDKNSLISSVDAFHVSYEDSDGAVILIEKEKWSWETLIITHFPREQGDRAGMPIFSNVPLSKGVHFLIFDYSKALPSYITCGILNKEGVQFSQSYSRSSSRLFPRGVIPDQLTSATALGIWHCSDGGEGSTGILVDTNRGKFYGCSLTDDSWIVVETMDFPSEAQYFPFMWCYTKPGGPVSVKHTLTIPSELQSL